MLIHLNGMPGVGKLIVIQFLGKTVTKSIRYILFLFVILLFFSVSPVLHAEHLLPEDVTAFITKRDLCDHFRGEDPYDAERAAYISKMLEKNCLGTDQALDQLRKKYNHVPEIIKTLSIYEDEIEPSPSIEPK